MNNRRDFSPSKGGTLSGEGSASAGTPSKRGNLNPDSPAFVPSSTIITSSSSVSTFRVEAPEFTPTKPTFRPQNNRPPPPNRDSNAMDLRLWMNPDLKTELSQYNHWLLYKSAQLPNWPADLRGYTDLLPFSGAGDFDVTPRIPESLVPEGFTTGRSRKSTTGKLHTLFIFHGIELEDCSAFSSFDSYRRLDSPFIVKLNEAFTTHQLGEADLVVVYENHPGAIKFEVASSYLRGDAYVLHIQTWISQLLCMIWTVHQAGLSLDSILCMENLTLTISMDRIMLMGFGLYELLHSARKFSIPGTMKDRQSKDYENLCGIIDSLLSQVVSTRLDLMSRTINILNLLPPVSEYSLEDLGKVLLQSAVFDDVMLTLYRRSMLLEGELAKQLENDRLFRIISKLGFINERQSHAHDQNWSETGDRYILKLFRDFVFHSQNENGQPIVSMLHVIDALNKLDCGTDEPIMLMSRNGDQCIFVTYADIRQKLDLAYSELVGS